MSKLSLLMENIVITSVTSFYKEWVIRRKNSHNNYNSCQQYFNKYGVGNFQFSWASKMYETWIKSDKYIEDIDTIKKWYKEDVINGFNITMEEIIYMEDEEEDIIKYTKMLDTFNSFDNNKSKFEYLEELFEEDNYYPNNFSETWLFTLFDDRIVSDV